jgi:hypothetical protein
MVTMNAYQLYEAVFDSARKEFVPETTEGKVLDVLEYAEGALDISISREIAERIVAAHEAFFAAELNGGLDSNKYHYIVKSPLSEIGL